MLESVQLHRALKCQRVLYLALSRRRAYTCAAILGRKVQFSRGARRQVVTYDPIDLRAKGLYCDCDTISPYIVICT